MTYPVISPLARMITLAPPVFMGPELPHEPVAASLDADFTEFALTPVCAIDGASCCYHRAHDDCSRLACRGASGDGVDASGRRGSIV